MPTNPLDELAGVTLGEPVTWWPLAWGWWLLICLSIAVIGFMIYQWLKFRRLTVHKRDALGLLKQLDTTEANASRNAHAILKNCVMSYWPQHSVAQLSGAAWQSFLLEQLGHCALSDDKQKQLTDVIVSLETSLYAKQDSDVSLPTVIEAITIWIDKSVPPKGTNPSSAVVEVNHGG